jgi:hypothetical protein
MCRSSLGGSGAKAAGAIKAKSGKRLRQGDGQGEAGLDVKPGHEAVVEPCHPCHRQEGRWWLARNGGVDRAKLAADQGLQAI